MGRRANSRPPANPEFIRAALLTDFGLRDSFVAELRGAIWCLCPDAGVVDITHLIDPGDVRSGAYILGRAVRAMPGGTLFVAVVDPGVGSDRQAVLVRSGRSAFLAPDNGLLARALDWKSGFEVRVIGWEDTGSPQRSVTFHGRDIFAPVAGRLLNGERFDSIGRPGALEATHPPDEPHREGDCWVGEVVHSDRFGNIATNLPNRDAGRVVIAGRSIPRGVGYFSSRRGEPVWLEGSDGCIEVAINGESATAVTGVNMGDEVRVYDD